MRTFPVGALVRVRAISYIQQQFWLNVYGVDTNKIYRVVAIGDSPYNLGCRCIKNGDTLQVFHHSLLKRVQRREKLKLTPLELEFL